METKKYVAKKGLTRKKAKEILHDGTTHGKKITDKQRRYFGHVASGGKAQEGLVNAPADMQPAPQQGGQPQMGGQPMGDTPNQQPQQATIDVSLTLNRGGQQQPMGNMTIATPDDVKKLIQAIIQVMGQGGGQPQPQGQPDQPQGQPQ